MSRDFSRYDFTKFDPTQKYNLYIDCDPFKVFKVKGCYEQLLSKLTLGNLTHKNEGLIFRSKKHGYVITVKHMHHNSCDFIFLNTGSYQNSAMHNIKNGSVKDQTVPTLLGVGVVGEGFRGKGDVGAITYKLWRDMIRRCYDTNFHKNNQTYVGCCVSDNFKNYEYFHEWCSRQVGFNVKGFALDKDILHIGNKLYCENSCVFIPQQLNNLAIRGTKLRGEHPIGVSWSKQHQKFESYITRFGKRKHLGLYKDSESAFLTYKNAKEIYMRELAEVWKDQIDQRVYDVLMSWEVTHSG